jgi:hypothetical protein
MVLEIVFRGITYLFLNLEKKMHYFNSKDAEVICLSYFHLFLVTQVLQMCFQNS